MIVANHANAAHIVRCVNAHDELVAALDLLLHETGGVRNSIAWDSPARLEWLDRIDAARDKARAVLAKVQI